MGVFILSGLPAIILLWKYLTETLGLNPFAELMNDTGFWAAFYMLLTLSITPLRRWLTWFCKWRVLSYGKRLSDWNFLIKSRRMLGLWCFFYACAHAVIYLHFELDWWLEDFVLDITERQFIAVGIVSWVMLLLLAFTSPDAARKKMGKHWRRLHRLMYVLSILGVLHIYMEAKPTETDPLWYAAVVLILLGHRVLVRFIRRLKRREDTGLEVYRQSDPSQS